MDDLYKENILDHYKNPRNFGKLDKPTVRVEDHLVSCGDKLELDLLIERNIIKDVRFSGSGCAISMASASMLTEKIKGKKISILKTYKTNDILKLIKINLSPSRLKCALLSLELVQKAIINL